MRLRIGNLAKAKAVPVTGQAYQDPRDALNEFVSSAADDYAQTGRRGQRIRIVFRRGGKSPAIAVEDIGSGMSRDRLRQVAPSIFESSKARRRPDSGREGHRLSGSKHPSDAGGPGETPDAARPEPGRSRKLPSVAPEPTPGHARSRFDPGEGRVLYNDRHPDFLMVKDEEPALLDYLATLVAKEYVVYNNPRSSTNDLAEEMVRMLVRVRRHLPRRP